MTVRLLFNDSMIFHMQSVLEILASLIQPWSQQEPDGGVEGEWQDQGLEKGNEWVTVLLSFSLDSFED